MKICVIGAGIIAESHLNAMERLEGAQFAAIADIVPDKAVRLAGRYGGRAYGDYREMIGTERPDAAIITLPHSLHVEAFLFCAEHGVHALVEKPMTVSAAGCDAMIHAAGRNKVTLMPAHVGRFFPENIKAREYVVSGELGKLIMISDTRNADYFVPGRPGWFLSREQAGGGIFLNLGSHSVDKVLFLTGSSIVRIAGKAAIKEGYDIEGAAQAFFVLEDGVSASICCNGFITPCLNETMIYFAGGTLKLRTGEGLWVSHGQDYEAVTVLDADPFELQLKSFVNSIEKGVEPPVTGRDGKKVIDAVEKVYEYWKDASK
jgi:predicted dehydrogenase